MISLETCAQITYDILFIPAFSCCFRTSATLSSSTLLDLASDPTPVKTLENLEIKDHDETSATKAKPDLPSMATPFQSLADLAQTNQGKPNYKDSITNQRPLPCYSARTNLFSTQCTFFSSILTDVTLLKSEVNSSSSNAKKSNFILESKVLFNNRFHELRRFVPLWPYEINPKHWRDELSTLKRCNIFFYILFNCKASSIFSTFCFLTHGVTMSHFTLVIRVLSILNPV